MVTRDTFLTSPTRPLPLHVGLPAERGDGEAVVEGRRERRNRLIKIEDVIVRYEKRWEERERERKLETWKGQKTGWREE
ncbi:hypothetical protein E2C01_094024 [Portunus trituberculatus]|uniref:Uncharacterized protein n=1 Tax=Portunus trituberculatus TaxID=210409 RepID=A0A5B7JWJ4_PORTR|nr:hypothetical protein [Portunus trituberculatus]